MGEVPRFLSFGLCTTDFSFVNGLCVIFKAVCNSLSFISGSEHFRIVISFPDLSLLNDYK